MGREDTSRSEDVVEELLLLSSFCDGPSSSEEEVGDT